MGHIQGASLPATTWLEVNSAEPENFKRGLIEATGFVCMRGASFVCKFQLGCWPGFPSAVCWLLGFICILLSPRVAFFPSFHFEIPIVLTPCRGGIHGEGLLPRPLPSPGLS